MDVSGDHSGIIKLIAGLAKPPYSLVVLWIVVVRQDKQQKGFHYGEGNDEESGYGERG